MKKHNHEQMLHLYDQWRASGESRANFAINHGILPTNFYYWIRKFQQKAAPVSGFHHIPITEPSHKNQGELMASIQYPSGIRLELYSSFQNLSSSHVGLLKVLTEPTKTTSK